jgi:hypothetical protein
MFYRMAMPVPIADLAAITLFLRNRDETLSELQKVWVGGPWKRGGRGAPSQTGRPYKVLADGGDGVRYVHRLAADGTNSVGDVALKQRQGGVWVPVLQ